MSAEGTFWAWRQEVKPASAKLVLLCLGDCHNDRTGRCDPSAKHIAKKTGLNQKTVRQALRSLEDQGYIHVQLRPGASPVHILNTDGSTHNRVYPESGTPPEGSTRNRVYPESGIPENGSTQNRAGGLPNNGQGVYPISGTEPIREPKSNLQTSCPEPAGSAPPPDESPVVLRMPTNRTTTTGEEYPLRQAELDQLASLYPAVDAVATVRRATAWLIANPKRRKTAAGIPNFLNTWFAKEQDRPRPATRHTSLEQDLTDTSWATPAVEPPPVHPDRGGFKSLPKLQDLYTASDLEEVIYRCGGKLLGAQGLGETAARRELRDLIAQSGPGRVLDSVMVGMAGAHTSPGWLRQAVGQQAAEIPKDWTPGSNDLAQLAEAGLHDDLGVRSRDVFLNWFTHTGIRYSAWGDLFVRMCVIEWGRAEGGRDQYIRGLSAAETANHPAWSEPA